MKALSSRLTLHLPLILASIVFIAFLAVLIPYAVEQRGYVASMWHVASGAISGLAVGGGVAWFIGGVGIAAMGTAFALPVLAVGAGLGVVLGAGFGSGFTLIRFLSDPTRYEVDHLKLSGVVVVSLIVAAIAWWLGTIARSRLSRPVPSIDGI